MTKRKHILKFRGLLGKGLAVNTLLAASICFLLFACGDPTPSNLLSQEEMVLILREFHLAQAIVEKENVDLDIRKAKNSQVYDLILDQYGQDRETFYESYAYYLSQPHLMDSIYTRIIDQYNHKLPEEQEKKFRKEQKFPGKEMQKLVKRQADSLKRAQAKKGRNP